MQTNLTKEEKVSEIIITKEIKTNGLIEDLEIVVQLVIDQSTLKLKTLSKKGIKVISQVVELHSFAEKRPSNINLFQKISCAVSESMLKISRIERP